MAMIANTTVISGGRTYKAGQTITGLSAIDKAWMARAGYITEKVNRREEKQAADAKEQADEL